MTMIDEPQDLLSYVTPVAEVTVRANNLNLYEFLLSFWDVHLKCIAVKAGKWGKRIEIPLSNSVAFVIQLELSQIH